MKKIVLLLALIYFSVINMFSSPDSTLVKICFQRSSFDTISRVINIWDPSIMQYTMLTQLYHASDGTWINNRQNVFNISTAGDTIMSSFQTWLLSSWDIITASSMEYDSAHHIIKAYSLHFNGIGYDTTTYRKQVYDSLSHLISDTTFQYNSGWQYYSYGNIHYASLERLDSSIYFLYDSMQWNPYTYLKYYFDSSGRKSMSIDFEYLPATASWDSSYRTLYIYDDINNSDTIIQQSWMGSDWAICFDEFEYYNYDQLGRNYLYYMTCCGCGSYSSNYYYSGNTDSLSSEAFCNDQHGGSPECDSCIYYYQSMVSVAEPHIEDYVSLSGNPVHDELGIKYNSQLHSINARIYSITGKLIKEFTLKQSTHINVSDFPSGIYILEISTSNLSGRLKFIKY